MDSILSQLAAEKGQVFIVGQVGCIHRSFKSGLSFELFKTRINNFLMGQMSVKFLVWYLTVFSNYFSHVKSSYPLSHYSALLLVFEYLIKNKK